MSQPPKAPSWILHRTGIAGGTYRGVLTGADTPPDLTMSLGGEVLAQMEVTPLDTGDGWQVEGQIGLAPLTDGAQTIVVRTSDGDLLDSVTIVTGLGAPEDLRAELGSLRDEIAVLKAAFRRHVNDG